MLPKQQPFLIVSASGRALAAMARRAGFATVVLDLFADRDTAAQAQAVRKVSSDCALRFHSRRLQEAARGLAPVGRSAGLVYGAGLEGRTQLLARLTEGRTLFGNAPEVVARLKQPATLFQVLAQLEIPHPPVRTELPADPQGWLMKQGGGAGGIHIRPARFGQRAKTGCYFQRFIAGRSYSVLFVADGRAAQLIGFSEQWPAGSACPPAPFCYGGAISDAELPDQVCGEVADWVARLTWTTGLVGLNGVDFMVDVDGRPQFLEVNPRPTATAELYDVRSDGGLFRWHLEASAGVLPAGRIVPGPVRGHAIVYAAAPVTVPRWVRWPEWSSDHPAPRTRIAAGEPMCSVHAVAGAARQVERLLADRRKTILLSVMPLAA